MSAPSFRFATFDDVPAVVDLVDSAYRGDRSRQGWCTEADVLDGQRIDADMLREALSTEGTGVLLLESGGVLTGCCELRRPRDEGPVALGMFAVDPARQDGGWGRALLAEAERLARRDWGATASSSP